MVGKYKTICLCGSTKFKDMYLEAQKQLSLQKCIVVSVGLFGHSGDSEAMDEQTKSMLDDMHKRKIDMADAILVIDVPELNSDAIPYTGNSTKSEIQYAKLTGKQIFMLSDIQDDWQKVATLINMPSQNCKFCWYNGIGGDKCSECTNFDKFEWSCKFCKHRKDDSLEPECDIAFEAGYKDVGSCIEIDVNCIEIDVNSIPTAQQELEHYPNPEYQ